jgi:hypothetical protein
MQFHLHNIYNLPSAIRPSTSQYHTSDYCSPSLCFFSSLCSGALLVSLLLLDCLIFSLNNSSLSKFSLCLGLICDANISPIPVHQCRSNKPQTSLSTESASLDRFLLLSCRSAEADLWRFVGGVASLSLSLRRGLLSRFSLVSACDL